MESIAEDEDSTDARPPIDTITAAVMEIAAAQGRLLELVLSRASAQAAGVSAPLIKRQRELERRVSAQEKEIADLHLRLDRRADQIDEQEARLATLEKAREVGG